MLKELEPALLLGMAGLKQPFAVYCGFNTHNSGTSAMPQTPNSMVVFRAPENVF